MERLTPAQRLFLMRDAYDETWIGCATAAYRRVAKNLEAKGLGKCRGVGAVSRFHLNDVGRTARQQLICEQASRLTGLAMGEYE